VPDLVETKQEEDVAEDEKEGLPTILIVVLGILVAVSVWLFVKRKK
jgi:LPXTG-motif cell wall-anchored protein